MCEIQEIERELLDRIHCYAQSDLEGDYSTADCHWDAVQEILQALIEKVQETVHAASLLPPQTVHEEVLAQIPQTQAMEEHEGKTAD